MSPSPSDIPTPSTADHATLAAWWAEAVPVVAMDWDELERWSRRLRKLAHDVNNALVPAFAHTDLLRLKLGAQADLSQLDSLPAQLEVARATMQRAAGWTLRPAGLRQQPWAMVRADLLMICRQGGVTFEASEQAVTTDARWPQSAARQVLLGLVRNATEALAGRADGVVRLDVTQAGELLWYQVSDNGPGHDDVAAVARGEVVRHGRGHLGLGLPAAAAVVARYGGELRLSSDAGGFKAVAAVPISQDPAT